MHARSAHCNARFWLATVVLGVLAVAPEAGAEPTATLKAGYTIVRVAPDRMWSIERIDHRGRSFSELVSGNGVVIQFADGTWSGEGHGHETIESVELMVDGVPTPPEVGAYMGTLLTLSRVLVLDGSIRVRHTLTVSPDGLDQSTYLEGLAPGRGITFAYAETGTRANRLTAVTLRGRGETLAYNSTDRDDNSFYRPAAGTEANEVVQSDPDVGDGAITRWSVAPAAGTTVWIWDRATDNKLYLVARGYTDAGLDLSLVHSVRFCEGADC